MGIQDLSSIDAKSDLKARRNGLAPPKLDIETFRRRADVVAGSGTWEHKLEIALHGPAKLTETEFFSFELYDPFFSVEEIDRFVGRTRQKELYKLLNSPYSLSLSEDKALLELLLKGANLPATRTRAVFSRAQRHGFGATLSSVADVDQFLTSQVFPIFCKPNDGMLGIGAMTLTGYSARAVQIAGRQQVSVDRFCNYMATLTDAGFLFQDCISQDERVTDMFGNGLATLRMLTLMDAAPKIEAAFIRSAGGEHAADHRWQLGNTFAAIEMETGRIFNTVRHDAVGEFNPVRSNTETDTRVEGVCLPNWEDACKLACNAARLFPDVRVQSWDLAISSYGPVLIEFNWGGSLSMLQRAYRKGAYSDSFASHVEACAAHPLIVHPVH